MKLPGTVPLLAAMVVAILAALPVRAQSTLPAEGFAGLAFDQHPGAVLPADVRLVDDQGRSVSTADLFGQGRPVVLVFDYFRCTTLCGLVLGDLSAALAQVPLTPGRDYGLVAVSIDPRETARDAAALKARHFDRDPAFAGAARFLVGPEDEVRRLADTVGFPYRYDPAIGQFAHPAGVTLVSAGGRISRYVLGIGYDPLDLRLGLIDASRGTVASVADQLLLLCYAYDPAHGRYSLVIGNIVRAGGILTVAALGLLIFLASRKPSGGAR
ncbi:SCO family protein [Skermanella rosea]|uniref:SCO family protein n=1 Tax=Skermanella rosea TaxID=1817965 RepID=UPI0019342039|nr:SCO family protein [Skermanella rosea]UEM01800.1 SCO family protein [Skermanella rosea]